MKKLLLMTVAMLALGATMALAADTMNLSWTTCRTTTTNAAQDNFSPALPCDDGSLDGITKTLLCSFKNGNALSVWSGTTTVVKIRAPKPLAQFTTINPFWDLGTGGCRDGNLAPKPVVAAVGVCASPYALAPSDGQSTFPSISVSGNEVLYVNDRVRQTTTTALPLPGTAGGWISDVLNLALDGGATCLGCDSGASIQLLSIQYFGGSSNFTASTPEFKSCVTWLGGDVCPGATATRNSTWGQVKSLYR